MQGQPKAWQAGQAGSGNVHMCSRNQSSCHLLIFAIKQEGKGERERERDVERGQNNPRRGIELRVH